ncbi:ester cyclase [Danxiaibacter flavus]|uniref:Ester cyclase n=1 Tax=Danxiaibacter flavus TaxID=3049108 RepID=A0ABV3ZNJ2_9BACT|nr:ester cyclase [Chitinophagaceae bacterium DXS]
MKSFKLMLCTTLVASVFFTACSNNSGDKSTTAKNDTAAALTSSAAEVAQQKLDANKKLVKEFYQQLWGDKDTTAVDKYVAENMKQHNPLLKDGRDWLKMALRTMLTAKSIEKTTVDIKQVAADGDLVWLFIRDVAPNGKVFARVEIFRVENGKITENWMVTEPVPAKSANNNGYF